MFLPSVIAPWLNANILSVQRAKTQIPVQSPLEQAGQAYLSSDLMRYLIYHRGLTQQKA